MSSEAIRTAATLGAKIGHVFVATADNDGLPHVAAAGKITFIGERRVAVAAWFCPATLVNLEQNPRIALVAWDALTDSGFQLLGEVEKIEERAFLDGFVPESEGTTPPPQVERELLIRVDKVIPFSHAPHSDTET